jgi:signal transduction histidine kinase
MMAEKDERLSAERRQTDSSLLAERQGSDAAAAQEQSKIDVHADEVVDLARRVADKTLEEARAKADATLDSAGASIDAARKTTRVERTIADTVLDTERRSADSELQGQREDSPKSASGLVHVARAQTDKDLLLERGDSDEVLARILSELAGAVRLRDEFLSLVSHELRTPLTPLAPLLEVLSREAAKAPESPLAGRVTRYVHSASRQVQKLADLVASLLEVTRITSGRLSLELVPVDLGAVVREVTEMLREQAEAQGCELEVEAPSVLGVWDALRLEQAIADLLDNAIKFGAGKPIHILLSSTAEWARVTVRDQGIGIAPEDLLRIFDRFERAVSDRNYGGLGLGLYFCKSVVEAMGGTLAVESALGKGSCFTIQFPREAPTVHAPAPLTYEPDARE